MKNQTSLANRLRNVLVQREMTGSQLALRAGCSSDLIYKLMRGERKKTTFLPAIARALNVNIDELDPPQKPNFAGLLNCGEALNEWLVAPIDFIKPKLGKVRCAQFNRIPISKLRARRNHMRTI